MLNFWRIAWLLGLVLLSACHSKPEQAKVAFYHWRGKPDLGKKANRYLQDLAVERLYLRLFDMDYDPQQQQSKVVGKVSLPDAWQPSLVLVPTIFITNRCMLQQSPANAEAFATQLYENILLSLSEKLLARVKEVQLDCDWTANSQEAFFAVAKALKQKLKTEKNWDISATIRLHQYRYPEQTGVPPVDRGVLMFYNMGKLDGSNTQNSILDLSIAEQYLHGSQPYPLELEVALPLFSWLVWQRYGEVLNLISEIPEEQLKQTALYERQKENVFLVKKSHYLGGEYVYKGDQLRLEYIRLESLQSSLKLLKKYLPKKAQKSIIYYHLSPETRAKYAAEELKKIYF